MVRRKAFQNAQHIEPLGRPGFTSVRQEEKADAVGTGSPKLDRADKSPLYAEEHTYGRVRS